ncbi:hypothetical protein P618_200899 [Holospora obtusa F1]|uniref:Uncharacterized protein n=1 Tax=Holospora obtusa F1 TaxID=1399147 RepID=W6TDS2_HOLOB|nr:hypothetical protein [Holospora obtusa]ETZ06926.1 hypothetical protein P618_200899 [Holospora obtusa F1]
MSKFYTLFLSILTLTMGSALYAEGSVNAWILEIIQSQVPEDQKNEKVMAKIVNAVKDFKDSSVYDSSASKVMAGLFFKDIKWNEIDEPNLTKVIDKFLNEIKKSPPVPEREPSPVPEREPSPSPTTFTQTQADIIRLKGEIEMQKKVLDEKINSLKVLVDSEKKSISQEESEHFGTKITNVLDESIADSVNDMKNDISFEDVDKIAGVSEKMFSGNLEKKLFSKLKQGIEEDQKSIESTIDEVD